MKSNEERVQSIVLKAKRYKAERKMTLSTAAIVFCAVIAVTLQTSINENKVNINAKSSGERKEVASLYTNEENISTFSSKEELVSTLKELSENAKENYIGEAFISQMMLMTWSPTKLWNKAVDSKVKVLHKLNLQKAKTIQQQIHKYKVLMRQIL